MHKVLTFLLTWKLFYAMALIFHSSRFNTVEISSNLKWTSIKVLKKWKVCQLSRKKASCHSWILNFTEKTFERLQIAIPLIMANGYFQIWAQEHYFCQKNNKKSSAAKVFDYNWVTVALMVMASGWRSEGRGFESQ